MSTFLDLYPTEKPPEQQGMPRTREEVIQKIEARRVPCDLLIVGGGIHGAVAARLAAFNGLTTILLERGDYASATSSRSSKMAHGGLRYLEMGDLQQVFEGIRSREDLFKTAPHIVKPTQFLIPIKKGRFAEWLKMKIGLTLYDLLVFDRSRKHRWLTATQIPQDSLLASRDSLMGCYSYCDGYMDDARLVLDNIYAARQEGALCLNYAEVTSTKHEQYHAVSVGWRDTLTGASYQLHAGAVLNCAGPWAPHLGKITTDSSSVIYSRGAHLLFNKEWKGPPIFLPMPGKARYYWVWPHPAGTLVGTTERPVQDLPLDPIPSKDEVDEIVERLHKDIPEAGLTRDLIHYAYAGIRTLPRRLSKRPNEVARLSRKHRWSFHQGVLTLLGGKLTTASWTAEEGIRKIFKMAELRKRVVTLRGRPLPGANVEDARKELSSKLPSPLSQDHANALAGVLSRLGGRADEILRWDDGLQLVGGRIFKGEVRYALEFEQCATLEDLFRRRLEVEYLPDHGIPLLNELKTLLKEKWGDEEFERQSQSYQERLERLALVWKRDR